MKFRISNRQKLTSSTVNREGNFYVGSSTEWELYQWTEGIWISKGTFTEKAHAENYAKSLKEALEKSDFKEETIEFEL